MKPRDVIHVYFDVHDVAALYPRIEGVDCWDETRDARKYAGPYPVVAHPACGPWGRLRHLYKGGEGDHELAFHAILQVRKFGGVLEHPQGSKIFCEGILPKPGNPPDECGGYSIEVTQVEWGHVARKRTWLYLVGVPREALETPPLLGAQPTHWIGGGRKHKRDERGGSGGVIPPGIKACSPLQRRLTPPLFAEYLVRLARAARRA